MHVDAIGTAVDLRDAQIDLIDELSGQIRLRDIGVNAAKGLYADRSNGGVVQTLAHGTFLKAGLDNASVYAGPTTSGGRLTAPDPSTVRSRPDLPTPLPPS